MRGYARAESGSLAGEAVAAGVEMPCLAGPSHSDRNGIVGGCRGSGACPPGWAGKRRGPELRLGGSASRAPPAHVASAARCPGRARGAQPLVGRENQLQVKRVRSGYLLSRTFLT